MTKFIVLLKCAYHFENFFAQLHFITQESQKIFWRGRELRWAYIFIFDVENRFKNISFKVVNIILIRGWIYIKQRQHCIWHKYWYCTYFAILSRPVHNRYIYFGYLFVLCVKPIPNLGELRQSQTKDTTKTR